MLTISSASFRCDSSVNSGWSVTVGQDVATDAKSLMSFSWRHDRSVLEPLLQMFIFLFVFFFRLDWIRSTSNFRQSLLFLYIRMQMTTLLTWKTSVFLVKLVIIWERFLSLTRSPSLHLPRCGFNREHTCNAMFADHQALATMFSCCSLSDSASTQVSATRD